jgi:predicted dehydrogenase
MALDLTQEQKDIGRDNYVRTAEQLPTMTRRRFLGAAAGVGGAAALGAAYFGYERLANGRPVPAALIGGGDEGGVLVGEHNPEFLEFRAVCDIRPYNMGRIFDGEPGNPLRKGFKKVYGKQAENNIKKFPEPDDFWRHLHENKDIEALVIALPLHLHAPVAIKAMKVGQERGKPLHVLCEKLMAWNVQQCKAMIRVAKETGSILSIGHQRHYSTLYHHANELLGSGLLGDVRHIRALWHRNNSWPFAFKDSDKALYVQENVTQPAMRDGWFLPIRRDDYAALADNPKLKEYGFDSIEQLVRWRLYNATGGGLMAELGSHQLDACSIFLGKKHPLAVTAVGGKYFYGPGRNDRDCEDHVYCTFEFPGRTYDARKNPEDLVVVTYSSVSTNQFEKYGECVMGDRGTMVVETEQDVMFWPEKDPNKKVAGDAKAMAVTVSASGGGKPAVEASSTWGGPSAPAGPGAAVPGAPSGGPVSRGYREEMEDFAYCVRLWDAKKGYTKGSDGKYEQRLPRCHGEVAMADAIIALTANRAMRPQAHRIEFDPRWFDAESPEVPDADAKPKIPVA